MKFNLNIKKYVFVGAAILCLSTSSCINDLDQNPIIDKGQSEIINESDCQSFLAKIYSGFGLSGNVGPSGGVQDLQALELILSENIIELQFTDNQILINI